MNSCACTAIMRTEERRTAHLGVAGDGLALEVVRLLIGVRRGVGVGLQCKGAAALKVGLRHGAARRLPAFKTRVGMPQLGLDLSLTDR